jgi:hypothetical protein
MSLRRCSGCRKCLDFIMFAGKRNPEKLLKTCIGCRSPEKMKQRTEAVKKYRQRLKDEKDAKVEKTELEKKEHRIKYNKNYYIKSKNKLIAEVEH